MSENESYKLFHKQCDMNPEVLIIFASEEFWIIRYHKCTMRGWSKHDVAEYIMHKIYKKTNITGLYDNTAKSVWLNEELKNFRIRNIQLRKYINQVNYIYGNAVRNYAVVSQIKYLDHICSCEKIDADKEATIKYLYENGLNEYIKEVEQLAEFNYVYHYNDVEISKTIDEIVCQINKKVNNH